MNELKELANIFMNNNFENLVLASIIFISIVTLKKLLVKYFFKFCRKVVKKTQNTFDDTLQKALEAPVKFIMNFLAVYFVVYYLSYTSNFYDIKNLSNKFLKLAEVIFIAWAIYNLTLENSVLYEKIKKEKDGKCNTIMFPFISIIIRISVIIIAIAIIAKEFGFTGFIAGLGISGLAFALAAQDTFSNLFGGVAIVLDKPFSIGDWVQTKEVEGVIENITFRSTRIRTFAKALVTVPNSKLAGSNIINWTQRNLRRITFTLSISNDTKVESLKTIIDSIEIMLDTNENVSKDIQIVNLNQIEKGSLDIYIYFYTNVIDFLKYQKVKEEINLNILEILQKNGVKLARESRNVYITKD